MRARLAFGEELGLPPGRVHAYVVSGAGRLGEHSLSGGDTIRGVDVTERLAATGSLDVLLWVLAGS